ncbi:3'-5' exonuclease [Hymenobacter koreensis]|uniref:Exonuclease domain-containing protein n=1 Tax=Hymenobacter koreensis TaxID=1084523 RepID=A0ABP8IWL7_9BACT
MAREYLLFIDTETTGLPARWNRPYSDEHAWPCVAQLAWLVYTAEGQLVKTDQDYLQIPEGSMPASAIVIHGLTPAFLRENGQEPAVVLGRLLADLATFRPRVVGHFLQLDFHVLGAAFARAAMPNPLPELPQFCTMRPPWPALLQEGPARYLRLDELHELLFAEPVAGFHDAFGDATATARCFFELQRRRVLTPAMLAEHPRLSEPAGPAGSRRWFGTVLAVGGLLSSFLYWLAHG